MSTSSLIALHPFKHPRAFATLACAAALTLAAGPALAQERAGLDRVEVSGRVVEAPARFDVRNSCPRVDDQIQDALQTTWVRERRAGRVQVQFVLEDGEVTGVKARGLSHTTERAVRDAVSELRCISTQAGAQIYRLEVDFIDPYARPAATADGGYRVAVTSR